MCRLRRHGHDPDACESATAAARAPRGGDGNPHSKPDAGAFLPVGAPIEFVLDDTVNSKKTQAGTMARIHLSKALVVGGVELAPAGAPGSLRVVSTRAAQAPDTDGAVQIDLQPLALPGGRGTLPISVTKAFITIEQTSGQQSTRGVMDTVEQILLPVAAIAQSFRKGRELVLPPGTIIRARTDASIDASHPATVVIATPAPFKLNTDVPHSGFTPIPLYTVPTPQPRTPAAPKPSATATPAATSSPSTSPTAAGTAPPSR